MNAITFTVQIQADAPNDSRKKKSVALQLCHDINEILQKCDGSVGGAQIIPVPKNIQSTKLCQD